MTVTVFCLQVLTAVCKFLDVGPQQYILSDESFLAATRYVEITAKVQTNIGGAGGTGGLLLYANPKVTANYVFPVVAP